MQLTSNATEEYVAEKLYEHIMKSVELYYTIYDVETSQHAILLDYSRILNAYKNKDDNFKEFHITSHIINDNILLTTALTLKLANKIQKFHFSCVIEPKIFEENLLN